VVENAHPIGELVRFVEVLSSEEDRHAVGDEAPDDLPHRAPAAGVEAGGRFVEEDDVGRADQRHGQVEAATHSAGVGGHRLGGGIDEVELRQKVGDAGLCPRPRQVVKVGHEPEVLRTGQEAVHRGELAGQTYDLSYGVRFTNDVMAADPRPAPPGLINVEKMCTIVVLPAPFGPSRAKTVPRGTSRSILSRTTLPPKDLLSPVAVIAVPSICAPSVSRCIAYCERYIAICRRRQGAGRRKPE
jgi:hypothetical protein